MRARYNDPRVIPLEVWDLVVDGTPLYDHARDENFGSALGRVAELLASGAAYAESCPAFPRECSFIDNVILTGGGARTIRWGSKTIRASNLADDFAAHPGGATILARHGVVNGIVVDLGQERLKLIRREKRAIHLRDLNKVPISARPNLAVGKEEMIEWVSESVRLFTEGAPPDGLVFALPCAIAANGAIGMCSYPWSEGDSVVDDILKASHLEDVPTWIVNDAELAAIGFAAQAPSHATTLVLTVGFGVGAALIVGDS